MPLLEHEIETLVIAWAMDRGWLCPKLAWIGETGWPDRTFFRDGKVVLIEFKAPGKTIYPKQRYWIDKLRSLDIPVFICDDVQEGIAFLLSHD